MFHGHDTTLKDCSGIRLSGGWILVAALVLMVLSLRGAGFWILLGLLPAVSGLRLAGRLQRAQSAGDFLVCLQIAARAVVSYGILVSLGLLLP